MPVDTLGDEVQGAIRGAEDFLRSDQDDKKLRQFHLKNLQGLEKRLSADIQERSTTYIAELHAKETGAIDAVWAGLNSDPRFLRTNAKQKVDQQTFDDLRRANGGAYPKNVSPILYAMPLVLVGIAEWYVNYATFEAIFIPVFAIAGTLLVAAVFAWASHMHGAYLKQLSEILHPSVEYRNTLGRKIALVIATLLLIAALTTVVWLRYSVISEQLGLNQNAVQGTFGQPSSTMIWSRLGPTIVLNILIWGLGTLYAWAINEKVPGLRESYRDLIRSNRKLERARKPCEAEQHRIKASFNREREKNQVAIKEYRTFVDQIEGLVERISQP